MNLKRLFTDHPASLGETYPEHMRIALSFAGPLAKATGASLVHAFLPFLFTVTASQTVKRLNDRIVNRCAKCPSGPLHRPDLFAGLAPRRAMLAPQESQLGWDPVI